MSTSNSDKSDGLPLPVRNSEDRRIIHCAGIAFVLIALVLIARPVKQKGVRESLFWYSKMYTETRFDIAVAGDSRVLQGIDPASMNETIGPSKRIVNVGFRSASFDREYVEFARRLLRNNSQDVLLLGITANAFTPRSMTDNGFIEQKKLAKRPYQIPGWCVDLERRFQRFALRELLSLVRGRTKEGSYETFHDNGWLEADQIPRNLEGAFALYRRRFDGNKVDQAAVTALIAQVQELVKAGIAIVAFEPPVPEEMRAIEDEHSGFDRATFKEQFRNAGGVWIDIDPSRYVTVDGSHLAPESARQLSKDLAAEMRNTLGWKADLK